MKYYISDVHFLHRKIKEMDKRRFDTLFEMTEYIIEHWNQKVKSSDEVYIIGDLSFGNGVQTWNILNRLNGKLYLVEGNHDYYYLDDPDFIDVFEEVLCYGEIVDQGRNVILSHYPLPFYNYQFHKDENNQDKTFMLYGHVHNTYDEYLLNRCINDSGSLIRKTISETEQTTPMNLINAFCVFSQYVPLSLDEWIVVDKKRRALINQKEQELAGIISYDCWESLNDWFLDASENAWKQEN